MAKIKNLLFIKFILILLFFSNIVKAKNINTPSFVKEYLKQNLHEYKLPKCRIKEDLKMYFVKNGQSSELSSIISDFNGDKTEDWAGFLTNDKNKLDAVVIYSQKGKYTHTILKSDIEIYKNYIYAGIFIEKPGEVYGFPFKGMSEKDCIANLKYPGIHIRFFETSSVLYYWHESNFKELWTSD